MGLLFLGLSIFNSDVHEKVYASEFQEYRYEMFAGKSDPLSLT